MRERQIDCLDRFWLLQTLLHGCYSRRGDWKASSRFRIYNWLRYRPSVEMSQGYFG